MMKALTACGVVFLVLLVSGCWDIDKPPPNRFPANPATTLVIDQCARAHLYEVCVTRPPTMVESANASMYESDRIRACNMASAQVAIRFMTTVKPECMAPLPPELR